MIDLIQFVLDEVPRQRRSYKKVAEAAGLDKDTLYRWREKRSAPVATVVQVLDVLGYELLVVRKGGRVDEEGS